MTPEIIATLISIAALAIAGYAIYKARQAGAPITGQLLTSTLQQSQATATEIAAVVKAGVFAAEQLKRTGKLPDNNAAFNYAFQFAKKVMPDLDRATLTTFIESFVPLASQVVDALPSKPETQPAAVQPVRHLGGHL